jgi:hypothetical protein
MITDAYGRGTFTDTAPLGVVRYTATVEAFGTNAAATASASLTTGPMATTLTVSVPSTAVASAPLTVSGQLTSLGAVVAGAPVSVTRSGCDGGWTGTAITTPNGSWSTSDLSPPVGTCTYRASYDGDTRHAPSEASAASIVSLGRTGLTLVAPARAEVGSSLALRGALSTGTAGLPGAAVTVNRSGCSTGVWSASTVTAADGTWSATDSAAPVGSCTYTAVYSGSDRHDASRASATTQVDLRTPALSMAVVRGAGSAKKTAYVTAQLGATLSNRTLTVTAQPSGGAEVTLASAAVDSAGRLTASYTPRTTTTYRVTFAGDAWYAPRTIAQTQ